MEQKTKVYLPNSYEQYLAQRKKGGPVRAGPVNPTPDGDDHDKSSKPTPVLAQPTEEDEEQVSRKDVKIVEKVVHSQYKKMFDEFSNNRFHAIKSRIKEELERLKERPPIDIPSVSDILSSLEIQSLQNIKAIREEFKLLPGKRSIEKLERMLNFNKFFIILNKQKRWKIFEHATFEEYQAGRTVYKAGDTDEWMYVIVKGCVKQYEEKVTSYNSKIMVNFTSHYEGSNFGEVQSYADNQTKGKRYHSIETTEACYLLRISNAYYRELISNAAEDDFEKKLNSLMESTIFRQTSKMMVTPLLSTLEKHILPYGKVLVRQGEEVRQLYFVAEGNLKVIYLDRARRSIRHLNIEDKPEGFHVTSRPLSQGKARSKSKNYSIHSKFYYPQTDDSTKEFIYGKKKLIVGSNQLEYNDQVVFVELRTGDFFGGKSFLSQLDRQKKEDSSQHFDASLKAKLSIISSSTQSLVYSIDEKKFFSLSETLQKLITKGIRESAYFDEYNIEEKLGAQREWKQYSEKLVEGVIRGKKDRAHSFRR